MGQNLGRGGLVQPWHLQQFGSLAVSGPAMVIMESATVEPEGAGVVGALALYSDEQEAALADLISAIRAFCDTKIGIQIVHWGRKVPTEQVIGSRKELGLDHHTVYAPSALSFGDGFPMPEELDQEGLDRIKQRFVESAERVARAGMDVLEVHAAHGFLLRQFYSPRSNQRRDAYGGSRERRIRYPVTAHHRWASAGPSHPTNTHWCRPPFRFGARPRTRRKTRADTQRRCGVWRQTLRRPALDQRRALRRERQRPLVGWIRAVTRALAIFEVLSPAGGGRPSPLSQRPSSRLTLCGQTHICGPRARRWFPGSGA